MKGVAVYKVVRPQMGMSSCTVFLRAGYVCG